MPSTELQAVQVITMESAVDVKARFLLVPAMVNSDPEAAAEAGELCLAVYDGNLTGSLLPLVAKDHVTAGDLPVTVAVKVKESVGPTLELWPR